MNEHFVGLFGASGFGREILPLLRKKLQSEGGQNAKIVFVDDDLRGEINDIQILTEKHFFAKEANKSFAIAIGSGRIRKKIAKKCVHNGIHPISIIEDNVSIYDGNYLGEGAIICAGCIITSNTRIGRYFQMNLMSYVAHDCVIGDFVTFAPGVKCNGNVIVEDYAYIGTGAILRQGAPGKPLVIGKGAIVGMGAVVTKDVLANETVIGSPARALERRTAT